MQNALTIDLEPWCDTELVQRSLPASRREGFPPRHRAGVDKVLEVLDLHGVHATFFVTGQIARRAPAMVRELAELGHEIACHHHEHVQVMGHSPQRFRVEVAAALAALQDATGLPVRGYRAPTWSIVRDNLRLLEVLEELGFHYDSSIQPSPIGPWGIGSLYPYPFRIKGLRLIELPPTVLRLEFLRVPFSGGFFFRLFPTRLFARHIQHLNAKGHPAVVYAHTWEFDHELPRLPLSPHARFIQYHNIETMEGRLRFLLEKVPGFCTMAELVRDTERSLPVIDLGLAA